MGDKVKLKVLLRGKPFRPTYGLVGYSTVVFIALDDGKTILYDCGSKICALQIKEALKIEGLMTEVITHVVISHLHFDHVGNLPLFSNAEILLSETEWESANQTPDEWHSIQTLAYLEKRGNLRLVKEGDIISEEVSVMELPGHTPRLIGLCCGAETILC